MDSCPFCNYQNSPIATLVLENEHCIFVEFNNSIPEGSGMIIPKEHRENVFDLTEIEWQATYHLLKQVKVQIDNQYKPDGYNVGWNVGEVGGQEERSHERGQGCVRAG